MTKNQKSTQLKDSKQKSFVERLEELCKDKKLVEIIAYDKEVIGYIVEVGKDYVGVTYSVEKEIVQYTLNEKGEKVPENHISVTELITFLRFDDFNTISSILKQTVR